MSSGINLTPFTLYIKFSRCQLHTLLYFQTECGLYEKASILSLSKLEEEARGQRGGKCRRLSQVSIFWLSLVGRWLGTAQDCCRTAGRALHPEEALGKLGGIFPFALSTIKAK